MKSTGAEYHIPGNLTLVLPAHNEEDNIGIVVRAALETLPQYSPDFEILIVNDGSRDHTGAIIDALHDEDDRIIAIHHPVNQGYGDALKSGFTASTGDYVMFMDADRQFDVRDISLLAPFVNLFDTVAGFRMERSDPIHRRINAEIFNLSVRMLFGIHMRDLDCAFKIFRGNQIRSFALTSSGALINAEIQAKLRRQGSTMVQVGVPHHPRVAGQATGGDIKVILRAMRETVSLWVRMHRYQPPADAGSPRPYYPMGDVMIAAGTVTMAAVVGKLRRR